jgi:hypothetical protein
MTDTGGDMVTLRVSDADRNGTMRRLHNAVALGLIDINEFEQRSSRVSYARTRPELDGLVGDLPGPGAIVTSAADRVELRGWAGSLRRHGEWMVPTRLALVRRLGSVKLELTKARFAGPVVVVELDVRFGSVDIWLPDGASASIDDVEVYGGSARDQRKDAPGEGRPHVVLTGRVVCGSAIPHLAPLLGTHRRRPAGAIKLAACLFAPRFRPECCPRLCRCPTASRAPSMSASRQPGRAPSRGCRHLR